MSALEPLAQARVVVCLGPGGVGKTTVAAALGIALARRGRRTFVLTVDPARRLADALGVALGNAAVRVDLPDEAARLDAAMLDTQAGYDALIERIATAAQRDAVYGSAIYRAFSRTLARSHAYVALDRVVQAEASGRYDCVVVDTPPLRSALEILDAPGHLTRLFDAGLVKALTRRERGTLSRLVPLGASAARRLIAAVASRRLADELSDFFGALSPLEAGLSHSAERARQLLLGPETAHVLVVSPSETSLADAAFLRDGLAERGVLPRLCIESRAYAAEPGQPELPVEERGAGVDPRLDALRARVVRQNRDADARLNAFAPSCARARLPEVDPPPTDVASLSALARMLDPGTT